MPEKPRYQDLAFRKTIPLMKEILELKELNELGASTMKWFETKAREELYDTQNDPDEFNNLADDPQYQAKLEEMRAVFQVWKTLTGDLSEMPESQMIQSMWNGQNEPPMTAKPVVVETDKGVRLFCDTEGASIGYQVRLANEADKALERPIISWDFATLLNPKVKNGLIHESEKPWTVYDHHPIVLEQGDTLVVKAMRIGYQEANIFFTK